MTRARSVHPCRGDGPRRALLACSLAAALSPATALAEELYLGANPSDLGALTIVGLADGTSWTAADLEAGSTIAAGTVDRAAVEEVDLDGVHRFALRASSPLLAYLGYDCCAVGGSTFLPTEDGHARVGRAFLLYLPVIGVQSDLVVFAVEEARVVIAELDGTVVGSRQLEAGRAWIAYPVVGAHPYLVRSTGDIAIMLSAVNGLASVPPTSREGSCDGDVGREFHLATHSWGGGGIAIFAYEAARVTVRPMPEGEPEAEAELAEGEWLFVGDMGRRAHRVSATGDVAVWAGDLEGGETIDFLGDDMSVNLGRSGLDVLFHSQSHGAVVFATADATAVTLDGVDHALDAEGWLDVPPGAIAHATASAPIVALTFGGNGLNDWGGLLRPAPTGAPPSETCPDLDADLPGGDADADLDADAMDGGDADGDPDDDADPEGDLPDAEADADGASSPRPSCDCSAARPAPLRAARAALAALLG